MSGTPVRSLVPAPTLDALARDPAAAVRLAPEERAALLVQVAAILTALGSAPSVKEAPVSVPDDSHLLDVDEVADRLRLSKPYVYELIRTRALASVRLGRKVRVQPTALAAFVEKRA